MNLSVPHVEPEVVDLLDSDDEHVMATPAAPQQAPAQNRAAAAYREAGPSEVAPDADDTHVAQLVDMGFTPEQATTVRQPSSFQYSSPSRILRNINGLGVGKQMSSPP